MSNSSPHLLVAISAHGYGHLALTAPVIAHLRQRIDDLRLTVRSALPLSLLQQRIGGDFGHQAVADDFGMVQLGALRVDRDASAARYAALHQDWSASVARVANDLAAVDADLLLSNIPYLTLAAAGSIGLPSVALCCLNWAEIYTPYCRHRPEAALVRQQMVDSYRSVECFIAPEPSMPMASVADRLLAVPPIALATEGDRAVLAARLGLRSGQRLALVALGGIDTRLPIAAWPESADLHWLVPAAWQVVRSDVTAIEAIGLSFSQILASVDLVLTKPGYGTVTEAVANGIPVLYVRRGDWPEEPAIVAWMQRYARHQPISQQQLADGDLLPAIDRLLAQPPVVAPSFNGAAEAAAWIADRLGH
jgi:hypothetical protein